ncbi:MAG: hypothetical protein IPK16_17190 [Anaerolineales bacterium]|nr:hypothetical protein [Anaerolineales bacterium]
MPGIVGYWGNIEKPHGEALLARMLAALRVNERQANEVWADNGIGLGRLYLDSQRQNRQPVWNASATLCIVFDGELFEDEEERRVRCAQYPGADGAAQYVLSLFEATGANCIEQLNGSFVGAIWDLPSATLTLFNDRIGSRPLYFVRAGDRTLFASGLRAILADANVPRRLDRVAIAQLLSYEYALQQRSLLEGVELLPPATVMQLGPEGVAAKRYWRPVFKAVMPYRDRIEELDRLYAALVRAMERQRVTLTGAGINLSGGLDSRMVLALLCKDQRCSDLRTYTFGVPGCDDERVAKRLAQTAGAQHQFLELKPDFLLARAETGVRITDGMKGCTHLQSVAFAQQQAQSISTIYTGYLLDALSTPDVTRDCIGRFSDEEALALLHRQIWRLFPDVAPNTMFTDEFWTAAKPEFTESFRAAALEAKDQNFATWHNSFELQQRQRRFTQLGNVLLREYMTCRTPFTDRELIETTVDVSLGMRIDRFWVLQIFATYARVYGKVPWEQTGLPLVEGMHSLAIRVEHQSRWYLRNIGANWVQPIQARPYQQYESWMRAALRPWIEDLLLSPRSLGRGILRPAFQRELIRAHMAGANHAKEIGMLLSIELWLRAYVD